MHNKQSFEKQITQLFLIASLPLYALLLWVMVYADISLPLILLTALIGAIVITYCHSQIYQKSSFQFRSLSNLLDAMIQGDYSLRARTSEGATALNELLASINGLAERLNKQRIESVESQLLVHTVISHIDVAIIALDANNDVVLINPAANKLLKLPENNKQHSSFDQLAQLGEFKRGQSKVMTLKFGHQQGKFNVHVEEFRESGKQHKLLFITDVSNLLRSEERNAWQSLVRVISHEINNSLAPISSISQTLQRLLSRQEDIESHKDNLVEGLSIISQRTNNLKDFVNSYKQIARLPEPEKKETSIAGLINKIIPLYQDSDVNVVSEEDVILTIDPIQFEQVLINLIKNAVESVQSTESEGNIDISWNVQADLFSLMVSDQGAGISNPDNLFVPFYTTKQQGSGIGLVLCRQILEVHGGQLTLSNRTDTRGCLATIELPMR